MSEVLAFWNRAPCGAHHSAAPIGSREYFDEVAAKRYFVQPHIREFAQFERWKGKRVLEIGCGIGTDGEEFVKAGAFYHGVDPSHASLEIARKRRNMFVSSDTAKCVSGTADLVYSFGVIHHVEKPEEVIEEARRIVKDEGEFRLMLYAKHSWKDAMIEAGFDQPEAQAGCPIARTYTPGQAVTLLMPHFSVESIEQAHIFPWKVKPYREGRYKMQPWFKKMPAEMFAALEKRFGWHLLIVARPC